MELQTKSKSSWISLVAAAQFVICLFRPVSMPSRDEACQADEEVIAREKARTQETYQKRVTTLFRQAAATS